MAFGRFNLDFPLPITLFDNLKNKFSMSSHSPHITSYKTLGIILIVLLAFTFLTISITSIHLAAWTVAVALVIASIKAFLVLTYFMHLKYESRLLKVLVTMVFLLFALVIAITFVDYLYR